jgi:hypothetical protein
VEYLPAGASHLTITKCTIIDTISPISDLEEGNVVNHRSCDAHDDEHHCCCQKKEGTNIVDESSEAHFEVVWWVV